MERIEPAFDEVGGNGVGSGSGGLATPNNNWTVGPIGADLGRRLNAMAT